MSKLGCSLNCFRESGKIGVTITTTPKSSPTQHASGNKSGDSRDSSSSPPTKVARTSTSSTSYHSSTNKTPTTTSETSSSGARNTSPSHQPQTNKAPKEKDPYHFSTKRESKFEEEARALLAKGNKDRSTKSPAKATPERKHSSASVSSNSGGTNSSNTGREVPHPPTQLSTGSSISLTPTLPNGKVSRTVSVGSHHATPPSLIPSTPLTFREENNNYNGSNSSSIGGSSAEENNNALPAEYWLNRQPLADQIVITDVTVCDMTVTIRECKTKQGFFKERDANNPNNGADTDTKIITLSNDNKSLMNPNNSVSNTGNSQLKTTVNPVNCQNGSGNGPTGNAMQQGILHRLQQQSATSVSSGK